MRQTVILFSRTFQKTDGFSDDNDCHPTETCTKLTVVFASWWRLLFLGARGVVGVTFSLNQIISLLRASLHEARGLEVGLFSSA